MAARGVQVPARLSLVSAIAKGRGNVSAVNFGLVALEGVVFRGAKKARLIALPLGVTPINLAAAV